MEIKNKIIVPVGINKDFGNNAFPEDKLYDAFNIKYLAQSDNSTYVLQNERGNLLCTLSTPVLGYINGTCGTDNFIILFTTTKITSTTLNPIDRIYKISKADTVYTNTLLFEGVLGFCLENPIQTLYIYETINIQKVYWTDNLNSPRYINIATNTLETDSKKFEFVPEFSMDTTMSIVKGTIDGSFTAGTVQYAISYFYKNGAETTIFDISPIVYASYEDRAGKPGDIVNCSFTLTITNVDDSFDYVRIYTIERSSIDTAPTCRKIDIKLEDSVEVDLEGKKYISFIDNGKVGTIITSDSLLYVGGESILLGTIASRENVLFGGNITINRPSLETVKDLFTYSDITFTWYNAATTVLLESPGKGKTVYGYTPLSLNEVGTARRYFKNNEVYRIGFQAQYKTGKWSEVLYLGEDYKCTLPISMLSDITTPEIKFSPVLGKFVLPLNVITKLQELEYIAVRPVFVQPTANDKRVIAQGLITNTISYGLDMTSIEAYSDYILRTDSYFDTSPYAFPSTTTDDKLQPIHFSSRHSTPIISTTASTSGQSYKQESLYPKSGPNTAIALSVQNTYLGESIEFNHNFVNNRFKELDVYCENLSYSQLADDEINHISENILADPESLGTDMRDGYFVNTSILDFWSPDIEFNTDIDSSISSSIKLKLIGLIPFTSSSISTEVLVASSQDDVTYTPSEFKEEHITSFQDYVSPAFDYTTSQGRTKASYAIGFKPYGTSSSIDAVQSFILPTWCRKNLLYVAGNNYHNGTTSLSKKAVGRFNYSSFNRYFNSDYIKTIDIYTPTANRYETNDSMISSLKTSTTSSAMIQSGMNKLFTNPTDVTISNLIKYKTAPHWTLAPKETEVNGTTYRTVLPRLTWISPTIWYTVYPAFLDGGLTYIQDSIIAGATVNQGNTVFSDGQIPKNGETFCYLGELIRELGNSQYGGQKLVNGSYENVTRLTELPEESIRLTENDVQRFIDNDSFVPGSSHIVATQTALQNNIWIPCGDKVFINGATTSKEIICNIGDTFLQRYDLVKNGPITMTSDTGVTSIAETDYQTNTSVVSFLVETSINLDGRYDKNRYNTFVNTITADNYNKINTVYSQPNNFFTYRGLDYTIFNTDVFKNSFTWSNTKILGELVDSWTGLDMLNVYDCDGSLGEITSFKTLGMYLIGFQKTGIFNVLQNIRTAIPTNDGMPIELASVQGVSGVRYVTTTSGSASTMATAVSPKGLYFIDANNKYIGRYASDGIANLSELKFIKSWSYNNIAADDLVSFYNSSGFAIYVDQINSLVYFVNSTTCLIYSESIEQFLGFYSYEGMLSLFNIWGEVYTISSNSGLYIQHKGLYNNYFGVYQPSTITFKFNPDPLLDKTFNWLETNFDAFSDNSNSIRITEGAEIRDLEDDGYYRILESTGNVYMPNVFFDTLNVDTEFQTNEVALTYSMSGNVQKKFRKWRVGLPRERGTINRFRNNWIDVKLTFTPNEIDNIKFNIYNTGIYYTIH